jgi:hypothetical protein
LRDASQDVFLAAFLELSGQQELVQNVIGFGEGEDDVELADVAIVFVHLFDVSVNNFESNQLVILRVAAGDEEQRSVSSVYDLGVWQKGLA